MPRAAAPFQLQCAGAPHACRKVVMRSWHDASCLLLLLTSRKWSMLQHAPLLSAAADGKSTEAEDTVAAAEVQQEHVRLQLHIQDLQKQVSRVM